MTTAPDPDSPAGWDAASQGYDDLIATMTMRYADALIERLEAEAASRVLEVAAGSGAFTEQLAPSVGSILATDFAPKMLDLARARLGAAGIENVECAVMDGMALEIEDASFDHAVCQFGLMLFPDRARGFSELRRSLRPGGRAVVAAWSHDFDAFKMFIGALRGAFPDLPAPPGPPPIFSLADTAAFTTEMETAGFRDVRIDLVERFLEPASGDVLWDMVTSGAPPAQVLLGKIGDEGAKKVRETMNAMLDERFGDGPIRLRNVATVGTGVAG